MNRKAIVLFSGGLDSATCIYDALNRGYQVIALSILYNQRHKIEIENGRRLLEVAGVNQHLVHELDLSIFGHSALTDDIDVPKGGADIGREDFIPITYVPARNLIFLSIATAAAEAHEADAIFIGVNNLDYSGYPDCRPDFIESFQQTSKLGTKQGREGRPVQIETPLINLSKKEIILKGSRMQIPYEYTWSCYDPQPGSTNDKVIPCGECDSCILRREGFRQAGLEDKALN